MKIASLEKNLVYNEIKPAITVLLESDFTKEIRIVFRNNQQMKEHQTPFPIIVEIFEGAIDFGVNGEILALQKGDLISLSGGVPHDLLAKADSIVRLTLSKLDHSQRVKEVD
ncbi:cupin domain-containing protein [Arundinibacter roseus]|uniref:Cupin n=1 Tax=Arundinibacter roseus TaxID=2070510 RepID=A0A4R4KB49_9BACT|nr:cupin [Arundinibacter roseus]TDB63952.1 cupin [Arundinibacter roseus]